MSTWNIKTVPNELLDLVQEVPGGMLRVSAGFFYLHRVRYGYREMS